RIAGRARDVADLPPQRLCDHLGAGERRIGKNDEELVSAVPAPDVAASQDSREQRADGLQHFVPADVAKSIVDALEMIDVEHDERERLIRSARPSDLAAELRSEEHTSELQSRFDLVCR